MNRSEGFLIVEQTSQTMIPNVINNKDTSITFECQLQEAEVPNRNKRIYSKDALFEALSSDVIKEKLNKGTFYGRLCPSLQ